MVEEASMTCRFWLSAAAAVAMAVGLGGCAASERQRPIQTSRIPESGNTLQAARKQLEGKWTLTALEYASPDGKRATIDGTVGSLTADDFGNMTIEYRVSDGGVRALEGLGFKPPDRVISTRGRVVINVDDKSIAYVGEGAGAKPFDANAAAARANPFALERTRYYDFAADGTLTLTTRHDDGKDAVVSRWKKG
jgi:hypothetical protein